MRITAAIKTNNGEKLTRVLAGFMGAYDGTILPDPVPIPILYVARTVKRTVIKGAVGLANVIGDDATNNVIALFKPVIKRKLESYLRVHEIKAEWDLYDIKKEDESMKITVNVNSVDYEGLICKYLPVIMKTLKDKMPEERLLWGIDEILGDDKEQIVRSVVSSLSDTQKEAIIKLIVERFGDNICKGISDYLTKQSVPFTVTDIGVE